MNKIAVLTVVFPSIVPYLDDYKKSLLNQTIKEFDILFVNDGLEESFLSEFFDGFQLKTLPPGKSRAKHREIGIQYAKENGYEYLILCDADDFFQEKRIEDSIKYLDEKDADIVVNNLDIVGETGNVVAKRYFSPRVSDKTVLNATFLYDKNIFGLSNTALRLSTIPDVVLPEKLIIVDWFLFAYLLEKGMKAVFIDKSLTFYRQHEENSIGINRATIETFKKQSLFKADHFKHLADCFEKYTDLYKKSQELMYLTDDEINTIIVKSEKMKNPLWWEIINK